MNKSSLTRLGLTFTAIAFGLAPTVLPAAERVAAGDSEQVAKLLSEARSMAFQLKADTSSMEFFPRINISSYSQVVAINQVRGEINDLAAHLTKLQALANEASPWQLSAIRRMEPFLDELGGYTNAIIEHLNGDRTHTLAAYQDYLQANADYATDLAALLADFTTFGNAKGKLERLGEKLEVPVR